MSQINKTLLGAALFSAFMLLPAAPFTHAQTGRQVDAKSARRLELKAALVLTPDLCGSKSSQGSFWTYGKETFFVGKVFCEEVNAGLKDTFSSLDTIASASSPGGAQIVLLPKVVTFSKTQKTFHYLADIVIGVEWTLKDSSGKTFWLETVQGHASDEHKRSISSNITKLYDQVLRAAMRDLLEQSASKMSASLELRKLATGIASPSN